MEREAGTGAQRLIVSSSPHMHSGESVTRIMFSVIGALIPAAVLGIVLFGLSAAITMALCIAGCIAVEAACQKAMKREITVADGSAALTGLLLAFNLPADAPWWMPLVGAAVAIGLAKQVFGGLGYNIFNPALVARAFLLISFPAQMTRFPQPKPILGIDAVSGATPLSQMKTELLVQGQLAATKAQSTLGMFVGDISGSMGEVSALALLIGAAYLLYKGYISWHTPVAFIGTVMIVTGIAHVIDPARYASPVFHLFAGGLILGAFFMATDMVTGPITRKGQLIFGTGCGLMTVVVRLWGGYPEGVMFSILIMNAATPLIDRWVKVKKFGAVKATPA